MLHGRRRNALAAIAIAIIVVLFAVLFYRFDGHRDAPTTNPTSSEQTNDLAGTVTNFPVQQQYGDMMPIVAPSDPNDVYKLVVPANGAAGQRVLARSGDGGATWQTFPVPTLGSDSKADSAFVSPLNPQDVFLTVSAFLPSKPPGVYPCPADLAPSGSLNSYATLSGGPGWCVKEFLSMDGGAHWKQSHLPADALAPTLGDTSGTLVSPYAPPRPALGVADTSMMVFQSQENRLYSVTNVESGNLRIVVSTDGGLTWTYTDEALVASNHPICDYSVSPTGSTLFAIVGFSNCGLGEPSLLWRSDDAGAHWVEAGQLSLSTSGEVGMMTVIRGDGQLPLLYINMEQVTVEGNYAKVTPQLSPTNIQVSADGGATWTFAPARGFPVAQPGNLLQNPGRPLGVLSDGSVLFLARTLKDVDTFYAWKFGDVSWHRLGPNFKTVSSAFVLPGAPNTVCVVTGFQSNYAVHMLSI